MTTNKSGRNWAKTGSTLGIKGVFYSFGRRRVGKGWVYFIPVPDGPMAERLAIFIEQGGRTVRIAGAIVDLQSAQFRHKRVS